MNLVKKFIVVLIIIFLLVAVTAAGAFLWWRSQLSAPSTSRETASVLVTKGATAGQIAKKLAEAGVIKNEFAFRLYTKLNNKAANLPVGEFEVPKNLSVSDVIAFMMKGPQELWVTIPEGLRREEYPDRFIEVLNLTGSAATAFREEFLEASEDKEGYLFPETYLVPKEVTAARVVSLLTNTFEKKFPNSTAREVILASLIEREAKTDKERPMIAGILENRIAIDMPLQIDATVQYARASALCRGATCADWWPTIYLEDYKLDHPYNTYTIPGLPPAPISNPGLTSLEAAKNPADNNYLFYIHDRDAQVHYAETFDEHNANIAKYLR